MNAVYVHYVDAKYKPSPCPICEMERKMEYKIIEYLNKRPTESWKGDAYFFRVYPPEHYNDPHSPIEPTTEYVIVSRVGNENMMFPANENGLPICMQEIYSMFNTVMGVKQWMESLGFNFVGDFNP